MKLIALDGQGSEFCIRYLDSLGVAVFIKGRFDVQALFGGCIADQADDNLPADERSAAPVSRDVAKHTVLDLVPYARARGKMADLDCPRN